MGPVRIKSAGIEGGTWVDRVAGLPAGGWLGAGDRG
jgi:hypothetical protein